MNPTETNGFATKDGEMENWVNEKSNLVFMLVFHFGIDRECELTYFETAEIHATQCFLILRRVPTRR
jgi:hypothetical protein